MNSIQERASRYIEKMPSAIQGQGGSLQAQKVCFTLVQGYGLEPSDAATVFKVDYNGKCIPPFPEAEILRKCRDSLKATPRGGRGFLLASQGSSTSNYVAPVKAAPVSKPKPKLFVSGERKPTVKECMEIAKSRNLPGPGSIVAAALGVLRVGEMFGHRVWGIGDENGPLSAVRRIDGKPFDARNESNPAKSLSLVSGSQYHRPYGYCLVPGIKGVALGEGLPDLLALWEAAVSESTIDPFKLDDVDHIRANLPWVPLMMLSATAKLVPGSSYIGDFRGYDVLLVPHTDDIGISKARDWFDSIKPVAKSASVFDCAKVRGQLGDDFNNVFNLISERILHV